MAQEVGEEPRNKTLRAFRVGLEEDLGRSTKVVTGQEATRGTVEGDTEGEGGEGGVEGEVVGGAETEGEKG